MAVIRIDGLAPERIGAILQSYEELVAVMVATNNELLVRLAAVEGTTDAHADVLNEWSAVCGQLQAAHDLELERLATILN